VQLANMTVFSAMRKAVYSDSTLMENIPTVKRYIDDGAGFFTGTADEYKLWLIAVNSRLKPYGLVIDESSIEPPDHYVPFLDIQFGFSSTGSLQTDLYTKPTDSRSYLNFRSAHPKHIFSGIVFSQFLRLRRIIKDHTRLAMRIDELKTCFRSSGYPSAMLDNIASRVLGMERSLARKGERDTQPEILLGTPSNIRVVSTFGSDSDLVKSVKQFESVLSRTRSFSQSDAFISPTTSNPVSRTTSPAPSQINVSSTKQQDGKRTSLFSFVKKTGASIRSKVVKTKELALGKRFGKTKPCRHRNCALCPMISSKERYRYNNTTVKTAEGSCSSYNVVYLVVCSICWKHYVGRTCRHLRARIGEHRRYFYQICNDGKFHIDNDEFALASHLYHDHGLSNKSDFSKIYKVAILEVCSPKVLDVKEHKYIHQLNALTPNGINLSNPFSIPILHRLIK
jgi:hypothetical protein